MRHKQFAPVNLFSEADAERYEEWHEDIYARLREVHHTVSTLECLSAYPLDEMFTESECHFWSLMSRNFWCGAVVTLDGLMDKKKGRVTIPALQERALGLNWLDPAAKTSFETAQVHAKFDQNTSEIRNLIREYRNLVYAHRFVNGKRGGISEPNSCLDLGALRKVFDAVEQQFQVCAIGDWYDSTAPFLYSAHGLNGSKNDPPGLKTILDSLVESRSVE